MEDRPTTTSPKSDTIGELAPPSQVVPQPPRSRHERYRVGRVDRVVRRRRQQEDEVWYALSLPCFLFRMDHLDVALTVLFRLG